MDLSITDLALCMLAKYFAQNGDNLSPLCGNCDNCLRVQAKPVSKVNLMSDVLKMVEVIEEMVSKLNENSKITSPKDIIQVYCQLKCDHEELTLSIYSDKTFKQERLIKAKAEALHLLDWLIICKMVKIMVNLYKPNSNGSTLQTNLYILGVIEGATARKLGNIILLTKIIFLLLLLLI